MEGQAAAASLKCSSDWIRGIGSGSKAWELQGTGMIRLYECSSVHCPGVVEAGRPGLIFPNAALLGPADGQTAELEGPKVA